ncbi:putative phage abortive infection protein [Lysobacter enzymogenes]|uniref:putative phage abortive infection protein n=1 Tax=Lysobacter enzymogenes TaxID=69 RepID=UPI001AFA86D2|nr:putative phage abortive infection protein [Lysobacter enzymogenes]QQQ01889.1 hypothetical protein JHW41_02555 [Lysobacter enzymogenes]
MSDYAHYFRSFYNVLDFLDGSKSVPFEQKKLYARTFRAQLSDIEIVSIFYNAIPVNQLGQSTVKRDMLQKYEFTSALVVGCLVHPIHNQVFREGRNIGGGDAKA